MAEMPELKPYPIPRFSLDAAQAAGGEWGLNCGPAAVAAVLGLTLNEIRPHLGDFESKHYTNPTLMWEILRNLKADWRASMIGVQGRTIGGRAPWPYYGLARVQWEGPWTAPGVPMRVRYRHTHWVGCAAEIGSDHNIFDVNCMCVGGWVPFSEWNSSVVPWLLQQCEPKANGKWHLTHIVEIEPPADIAAAIAAWNRREGGNG